MCKKETPVCDERSHARCRSIDRSVALKKKTEWEKERKTKTNQMKLKKDTKQRRWRRCFRPVFGWKFTSAGYDHIYYLYIHSTASTKSTFGDRSDAAGCKIWSINERRTVGCPGAATRSSCHFRLNALRLVTFNVDGPCGTPSCYCMLFRQ